ncbi:hypothetical protein FHS29_006203 [Saccharothrix tamanrassetensis]|uniref:AAA+ ATPase domain-containing protein n=1 Tax=Saccharothrix tamanrassetensis TaxID=1051531 RepID=A0A841CM82_9PSEU|nr:hypothetical protein [Saccharothrix tamanrassetensis]MBB5959582.1 hypothetical protein [Saccharothrix tamanrassetensis]
MSEHIVTCPTCQDRYPWAEGELLRWSPRDGRFTPVTLVDTANAVKLADLRAGCYVRCPNPSNDTPPHYIPVVYGNCPPPVIIGMVGRPRVGKTHLLAMMVHELLAGRAGGVGLTARPGDTVQHADFKRNKIAPLLRGERLAGTVENLVSYADFLLVDSPSGQRPVIFFDIAGEDFRRAGEGGPSSRFLLNTNALLFVEDVDHVVGRGASTNEWVDDALGRLGVVPQLRQVPAAIALTKADQLRYVHPVDRWLRAPDASGPLRAEDFTAESRDVYAVLDKYGAHFVRDLFDRFARCTLHFVSATGVAVDEESGTYPRGTRPMRVLRPLFALLAMTGVLGGPEALRVGL